ncbi:MAG: hypothetical protein JSR65_06735, partial [Proteobacteria bacterium]|nr:hypothetical protein [Pseudomonadota bacterium]
LAGVPKAVIAQARKVLSALEAQHSAATTASTTADATPQLGLFTVAPPSAAELALRELDPDAMTPKDALEALYRLKALR